MIGGAIGLGIGFGLQKVVSNLISGIILLLDRSIKPGDVIEVGETYGTVDSLGARCTSVITRDGTEWLIPNEDLITQRVANWSYSTKFVRRRVPIGIAYDSDIDLATALILEAASETERVLKDPATRCLLKGFGDNSVDLELRYWIDDPEDGISTVTDAVLRKSLEEVPGTPYRDPVPPTRPSHSKRPYSRENRTAGRLVANMQSSLQSRTCPLVPDARST